MNPVSCVFVALGLLVSSVVDATSQTLASPPPSLARTLGWPIDAKRDFGVRCDAVQSAGVWLGTDDTAALKAAVAAAESGETVYIGPGNCLVSSTISLAKSGVHLVGAGRVATRIISTAAAGHIISIAGVDGVWVEHLGVSASVEKAAGTAAIYVKDAHDSGARHFRIDLNIYYAVSLDGGPNQFIYKLEDFEINGGVTGIAVGTDGTPVQDLFISNGNITGSSESGILLANVSGFWFRDLDILMCGNGFSTYPNLGQKVVAGWLSNVHADSSKSHGWKIFSGGGIVSGITCTACGAMTNGSLLTDAGIYLASGAAPGATITGVTFVAPIVQNNKGSGIVLDGRVGTFGQVNIIAPNVGGNSRIGSSLKHGIEIVANTSNWSILGGQSGSGDILAGVAPNPQGYGILVNNGTSNNYIIKDVDLTGNVLAPLYDGGSGTSKTISDNKGFKNSANGWASISAATSVVVKHGLTITPAISDVLVTPVSDVGLGIRYWVSAADSTTFTLMASGSATFKFGWTIRTAGSQ